MTTAGLIFMLLSGGFILLLCAYCFYRVFAGAKNEKAADDTGA